MVIGALTIVAILGLIVFAGIVGNVSYRATTEENCKQYESVPEQYLYRVPDGCIPQYFKDKH